MGIWHYKVKWKKKDLFKINNLRIRDRIKDLLQNDFRALTELFFEKYMILNQKKKKKKCHINTEIEILIMTCLNLVVNSKEEVVLGATIDNKLAFDSHTKNILKFIWITVDFLIFSGGSNGKIGKKSVKLLTSQCYL